jgi:hypothetical protein
VGITRRVPDIGLYGAAQQGGPQGGHRLKESHGETRPRGPQDLACKASLRLGHPTLSKLPGFG